MIIQHLLAVSWLSLVALTYNRLLRKRQTADKRFRLLVIASGSCLIVAALIFWLSAFGDYSAWFIPVVYPILDWSQIALVICGIGLILWVFVERIDSTDANDVVDQDHQMTTVSSEYSANQSSRTGLAAINALRVALLQPYPFVELARLSLSSLCEVGRVSCGALYVYNESTQEMSVAASVGLTPEQERVFERLSVLSPIVAETLGSGEVLISTDFVRTISQDKLSAEECPGSFAALTPLLRNNQPLGLIVLFKESEFEFSGSQFSTLAQMSDIVSDKFANVKLRGELSRVNRKTADREDSRRRMSQKFQSVFETFENGADLNILCDELVGLGGADAVAIIETGDTESILHIKACSHDFPRTSSGFDGAAIQALGRQSLVLLSRENRKKSNYDPNKLLDANSQREPMALVAPLDSMVSNKSNKTSQIDRGILFWNSRSQFFLSPEELQDFQEWLHPLKVSLQQALSEKDVSGLSSALEVIREILTPKPANVSEKSLLNSFVESVQSAISVTTPCLVFEKSDSGQLRPMSAYSMPMESVSQLVVLPGEGVLGKCAALNSNALVQGDDNIKSAVDEYDMLNRDVFGEKFNNIGVVLAQLVIPIAINDSARYILSFFFSDSNKAEEYSRTLIPLCHLMAFVLSVKELQVEKGVNTLLLSSHANPVGIERENASNIINEINNDLVTIIGNCQLVADDPNLSGAVERVLKLVIERAEHSAEQLRVDRILNVEKDVANMLPTGKTNQSFVGQSDRHKASSSEECSLTDELRDFATNRVVGGQILLTHGKAREVEFELESDFTLNMPKDIVAAIVESLCHGLSRQADEREIVTVSVYRDGEFDYLDISRRWRNLPAANHIGAYARFGSPASLKGMFELPLEAISSLENTGVEIAIDNRSVRPAFVTMRKFVGDHSAMLILDGKKKLSIPRILAIDDQTMILDLLSAMCDSQGLQIDTFDSAPRAIAAFERGSHDIVISDVAMPQMDGWEVASAIKKLRPETYLIFITGWEEGLSAERLNAHDVNQVLKKPFRLEQLTAALQKAQQISSSTYIS